MEAFVLLVLKLYLLVFLFTRFGLPNFALGVDGTHIRLSVKPSEAELPAGVRPQDFWCRKQVSTF